MLSSQQLGERIAEDRKRRELTQADLAARLGVSRQTVIAIEKGERRPTSEELVRVAQTLQVSLHDLVKEHRAGGVVSPRFRLALGRRAADVDLRKVVDLLEEFGRRYLELERLNGISRIKAPLESLETFRESEANPSPPKLSAEDAARTVRGALGLGDGPASDIEARLEAEAGLRIFHLALPSSVAGVLIWGDEIGACVAVNRCHPQERQLWSLVHEAGHFLRDREAGDILSAAPPDRKDSSEVFAETFAKEFLLPASGVARRFSEVARANASRFTIEDVVEIARAFGVSFQAMCFRLEELELLPAGTYDRLRRQKFKVRDESEAKRSITETPTLPERYVRLALAAYESEKLSEGSLAEYLHTDRVTARGIYLDRRLLRMDEGADELETPLGLDLRVG